MKIKFNAKSFNINTEYYTAKYDQKNGNYISIHFDGIGADFFIASACDCGDGIDELIALEAPIITENSDNVTAVFPGKTTLWDKAEYKFIFTDKQVVYSYRVHGKGELETVCFFEGFQYNDPRMEDKFYPYFCGPGRHMAYHRPVKDFMQSSKPAFNSIFSYGINSTDKRFFGYYEDIIIRTDGDRHYLGGDWLATPSPFLFLMGNRNENRWVSMGLAVQPGENRFMGYKYSGGEGFGLELDYTGQTVVDGSWESPTIVMQPGSSNTEESLERYVSYLEEAGCIKAVDRSNNPTWWKKPIFGGWGEQVFHSNRWDNYLSGNHNDWKHDNCHLLGTQSAYETMLEQLEAKGIDPTILIIDNRWFDDKAHLDADPELWPDLKGFIADQHMKGRKVILWISPWGYCKSSKGKDVPMVEHMFVDEDDLYNLEIDTDVFYDACKRNHKKVKKSYSLPEPDLTDANWRFVADPENPDYIKRVKDKISYLLSPEGLDADGFEFDYTHFLPKFRGTKPIIPREGRRTWGVEALHSMISLYYKSAKQVKSDALIISHTFNPYFNDVIDMLRLQDIYTDNRYINDQMLHRATIAKMVAPGCEIHTDQHPMPSLEAWREYARFQPKIGNPCLYYVTGIETTKEKITDNDWEMLKNIWENYNRSL